MSSLWFPARKTNCPHCGKPLKIDLTLRIKPVIKEGELEAFDGQTDTKSK